MATYQVLSWHGIPVQVRARDKSGRVSKKLDDRFMNAVDKAAMASKNFDDEAYTNGFVWSESLEREGSAEDVASAIVLELEEQYPEIDYRQIARRLREEQSGDSE
jgi:hypothetical protein